MLTPPCPRLGGLLRLGGACLLSLAAALPRGTALAQTEHRVGLGVGYSHHAVMDTAATSLAYDGHLAATSLTYQGENGRLVWTARLGAAFGHMQATSHAGRTIRFVSREVDGSLDSVSVPVRASTLTADARVRVERMLPVGRVVLLAGGDVGFGLTNVQGFAAPGLMQMLSLAPSLGARVPLPNRQLVQVSARTVLAAWVSRMPYDQTVSLPGQTPYQGLVARGSGWRSLGHLQTLSIDAAYQRDFGARGTLRVNLALGYLHDDWPRSLRVIDTTAEVSLALRIGGRS